MTGDGRPPWPVSRQTKARPYHGRPVLSDRRPDRAASRPRRQPGARLTLDNTRRPQPPRYPADLRPRTRPPPGRRLVPRDTGPPTPTPTHGRQWRQRPTATRTRAARLTNAPPRLNWRAASGLNPVTVPDLAEGRALCRTAARPGRPARPMATRPGQAARPGPNLGNPGAPLPACGSSKRFVTDSLLPTLPRSSRVMREIEGKFSIRQLA